MKTFKKLSYAPLTWLGLLILFLALTAVLKLTVKAQDNSGGAPLAAWSDAGIGAAGTFQADAGGVYAVTDSGAEVWGKSDSFHYVYQPLNGNGQLTVRVLGTGSQRLGEGRRDDP
jgi:hypothetical protein